VADGTNVQGPTILSHASEAVGHEARDVRVFLCFLVAGMVPPMSLFLHATLSMYSVVLAHLHPNALLTPAIFQYFYEAFVGVRPSVALFRVFFEHLDTGGAISGCLSFRLCSDMVTRFISMPNKEWEEWRANWCCVRFSKENDPMAYAEPTGFPEVLPVWTSPASMTSLEAIVERIQNLRDNHLAAQHMVNSFVHHKIAPLQWRSCPHWEVLSRNHPTRLHLDSPSEGDRAKVSDVSMRS
jgi:hypothetical protein